MEDKNCYTDEHPLRRLITGRTKSRGYPLTAKKEESSPRPNSPFQLPSPSLQNLPVFPFRSFMAIRASRGSLAELLVPFWASTRPSTTDQKTRLYLSS